MPSGKNSIGSEERDIRALLPLDERMREHAKLTAEFLRRLPPAHLQAKKLCALRGVARAYHASIRGFRWWDITVKANERALLATVHRPDGAFSILFVWKQTAESVDGRVIVADLDRGSWAFDRDAAGGWRWEIETESFGTILSQFEAWLATPVPPLPSGQMMRSMLP